jgi:hypothetical protein
MQHRLRIDEMTLGVSLEGSQMSHETLPLDEVARCARWMVGSFKQEDIDKVPMRPTQGFEPLVTIVLLMLGSLSFLGPVDRNWSSFACRICPWSRTRCHRSRRIMPLER